MPDPEIPSPDLGAALLDAPAGDMAIATSGPEQMQKLRLAIHQAGMRADLGDPDTSKAQQPSVAPKAVAPAAANAANMTRVIVPDEATALLLNDMLGHSVSDSKKLPGTTYGKGADDKWSVNVQNSELAANGMGADDLQQLGGMAVRKITSDKLTPEGVKELIGKRGRTLPVRNDTLFDASARDTSAASGNGTQAPAVESSQGGARPLDDQPADVIKRAADAAKGRRPAQAAPQAAATQAPEEPFVQRAGKHVIVPDAAMKATIEGAGIKLPPNAATINAETWVLNSIKPQLETLGVKVQLLGTQGTHSSLLVSGPDAKALNGYLANIEDQLAASNVMATAISEKLLKLNMPNLTPETLNGMDVSGIKKLAGDLQKTSTVIGAANPFGEVNAAIDAYDKATLAMGEAIKAGKPIPAVEPQAPAAAPAAPKVATPSPELQEHIDRLGGKDPREVLGLKKNQPLTAENIQAAYDKEIKDLQKPRPKSTTLEIADSFGEIKAARAVLEHQMANPAPASAPEAAAPAAAGPSRTRTAAASIGKFFRESSQNDINQVRGDIRAVSNTIGTIVDKTAAVGTKLIDTLAEKLPHVLIKAEQLAHEAIDAAKHPGETFVNTMHGIDNKLAKMSGEGAPGTYSNIKSALEVMGLPDDASFAQVAERKKAFDAKFKEIESDYKSGKSGRTPEDVAIFKSLEAQYQAVKDAFDGKGNFGGVGSETNLNTYKEDLRNYRASMADPYAALGIEPSERANFTAPAQLEARMNAIQADYDSIPNPNSETKQALKLAKEAYQTLDTPDKIDNVNHNLRAQIDIKTADAIYKLNTNPNAKVDAYEYLDVKRTDTNEAIADRIGKFREHYAAELQSDDPQMRARAQKILGTVDVIEKRMENRAEYDAVLDQHEQAQAAAAKAAEAPKPAAPVATEPAPQVKAAAPTAQPEASAAPKTTPPVADTKSTPVAAPAAEPKITAANPADITSRSSDSKAAFGAMVEHTEHMTGAAPAKAPVAEPHMSSDTRAAFHAMGENNPTVAPHAQPGMIAPEAVHTTPHTATETVHVATGAPASSKWSVGEMRSGAVGTVNGVAALSGAVVQFSHWDDMSTNEKLLLSGQTAVGTVSLGIESYSLFKASQTAFPALTASTSALNVASNVIGTVGGMATMGISGYQMVNAISKGDTSGAFIHGSGFIAGGAGAYAGLYAIMGVAAPIPGLAELVAVGSSVAAPVSAVVMRFTSDAWNENTALMGEFNQDQSQRLQRTRAGTTAKFDDAGLPTAPDLNQYARLSQLDIALKGYGVKDENGNQVDIQSLRNDPEAIRQLVLFEGKQQVQATKDYQHALAERDAVFSRTEVQNHNLQQAENQLELAALATGALGELNGTKGMRGYAERLNEYNAVLKPIEEQYKDQANQFKELSKIYAEMRNASKVDIADKLGIADDPVAMQKLNGAVSHQQTNNEYKKLFVDLGEKIDRHVFDVSPEASRLYAIDRMSEKDRNQFLNEDPEHANFYVAAKNKETLLRLQEDREKTLAVMSVENPEKWKQYNAIKDMSQEQRQAYFSANDTASNFYLDEMIKQNAIKEYELCKSLADQTQTLRAQAVAEHKSPDGVPDLLAQHLQKNKDFLAAIDAKDPEGKYHLKDRQDLAWVGLSTDINQVYAKAQQYAPSLFAQEAKDAIAANTQKLNDMQALESALETKANELKVAKGGALDKPEGADKAQNAISEAMNKFNEHNKQLLAGAAKAKEERVATLLKPNNAELKDLNDIIALDNSRITSSQEDNKKMLASGAPDQERIALNNESIELAKTERLHTQEKIAEVNKKNADIIAVAGKEDDKELQGRLAINEAQLSTLKLNEAATRISVLKTQIETETRMAVNLDDYMPKVAQAETKPVQKAEQLVAAAMPKPEVVAPVTPATPIAAAPNGKTREAALQEDEGQKQLISFLSNFGGVGEMIGALLSSFMGGNNDNNQIRTADAAPAKNGERTAMTKEELDRKLGEQAALVKSEFTNLEKKHGAKCEDKPLAVAQAVPYGKAGERHV